MIGLVIVTHGNLADEFLTASSVIFSSELSMYPSFISPDLNQGIAPI